jgi:hypothetical protein
MMALSYIIEFMLKKRVSLMPEIPHVPQRRKIPRKTTTATLVGSRNANTIKRHLQTRRNVQVSKALHKMTVNAPFMAGTNG